MRYAFVFFASVAFAAPILEGVSVDGTVNNVVSEVSQVAGDASSVLEGVSLGSVKRQSLPSLSGVTAPVEGLVGNILNTVEGTLTPIYSTIQGATGGLNLPTRQLSSVTDTVDGVVGEVTGLTSGLNLPSLPARQLSSVTDTVDGVVGEVTGLTSGLNLPALPARQVAGIDLTNAVNEVVGTVAPAGLVSELPGAGDLNLPKRQVAGIDLTNAVNEVVGTVAPAGLVSEIPNAGDLNLPKRQLDTVTDTLNTVLAEVDGITSGLPAVNSLPVRRDLANLDLSSVVTTVDGILTEVLGLVGQIKVALGSVVSNLESANAAGGLESIEALVDELLADVQGVVNQTPVGLDLAQLNPTVAIVSNEVGGLVSTVEGLLDAGVTGEVIGDIKQTLAEITSIVDGLNL